MTSQSHLIRWTQASRSGNTFAFTTTIFLSNYTMQLQCLNDMPPDAGFQKKPFFRTYRRSGRGSNPGRPSSTQPSYLLRHPLRPQEFVQPKTLELEQIRVVNRDLLSVVYAKQLPARVQSVASNSATAFYNLDLKVLSSVSLGSTSLLKYKWRV
jgi:hypothetical protein